MKPEVDVAELVRDSVRRLLDASTAYRHTPVESQRAIAGDMARIGLYLAQPENVRANRLGGALAMIPLEPTASHELLADVNFPQFVAALVQAVFQAIVDSSVQQMDAYADLLKSVAQTVDQFTHDAISDDKARHWLSLAFSDCLIRDPNTGTISLRPGTACAEALPRFRFLPLPGPLRELKPADVEKTLVPAARRRLVAGRQQLAASMVLMGINRIGGAG